MQKPSTIPSARRKMAACLALILGATEAGHASVLTVTDCGDSASVPGTLRNRIAAAVDGDVVRALVCSKISLTQGTYVYVAHNITIEGPSSGELVISGGANDTPRTYHSVFRHDGTGTLTLEHLTVADGYYRQGGGVNSRGNVSLKYAVVRDCVAKSDPFITQEAQGGGIYAAGTVTLSNSTITRNVAAPDDSANGLASGGGVWAGKGFYSTLSTISDNRAPGASTAGGGVFVSAGNMTITSSTVSGNEANDGGGLFLDEVGGKNATISYSTISGNSATTNAAAELRTKNSSQYQVKIISSTIAENHAYTQAIATYSPTTVRNSTIAFNHAVNTSYAAGLYSTFDITAFSSIFANNEGFDVQVVTSSPPFIAGSGNLIVNTTSSVVADTLRSCPKLESLQTNSDPIATLALQSISPALGAGNLNGGNQTNDERGKPRNVSGVDIGAYERQPNAPPDDRIFLSAFAGKCN